VVPLDAIVGSVAADVEAPDTSLPWREQLKELATAIHEALDPGDLAGRLPQAALSPDVLALSDTGIAILTNAGFAPDEAARAWSWTRVWPRCRPPSAPARSWISSSPGVDEDEYPALAAASQPFAKALSNEPEAFAYGLDRLLDGGGERGGLVRAGGERGEELDELLVGPAGSVPGHASARTTRVWLWKPVGPLVRAISP